MPDRQGRLAEVATKADLRELKVRLEIKLSQLEAKIDRVKFDLLEWTIPLVLGQAAFIVILFKVLD